MPTSCKAKEGYYVNPLFLPEQIIKDILIRLPVKSLIRFQCVCKDWKNLIKSQTFIQQHLHHSTIQNPCLLFTHPPPPDLFVLNNDMKVVQLRYPSMFDRFPQLHLQIVGSANGLLCLKNSSFWPFFLWNPAIRDLRQVPKPKPKPIGIPPICYNPIVGFGYNSIVNDYNILTIDNYIGVQDLCARVYSLKTGSWKGVESSPLKEVALIYYTSFAANGSILWIGINNFMHVDAKDFVLVLASYNIALEVFMVKSLPISPVNTSDLPFTRLTIHENKVAILSLIQNSTCSLIDLWVMEDEISVERCVWTKKFSVCHPFWSIPLAIWRNKMVYLDRSAYADGEKFERLFIGLIDLTTSEVNMYNIFLDGILNPSDPFINFVESLVPVNNNHIEEF